MLPAKTSIDIGNLPGNDWTVFTQVTDQELDLIRNGSRPSRSPFFQGPAPLAYGPYEQMVEQVAISLQLAEDSQPVVVIGPNGKAYQVDYTTETMTYLGTV